MPRRAGKRARCAWTAVGYGCPVSSLQSSRALRAPPAWEQPAKDNRRQDPEPLLGPGGPPPSPPPRPVHHNRWAETPRWFGGEGLPFLPPRRDPAPQGRLVLCTAGITFHPVHYLTRRPFAHRFHDQSHGYGIGSVRGVEPRHRTNSAAWATLRWGPLLAAASLGGQLRKQLLCVGSLLCNLS